MTHIRSLVRLLIALLQELSDETAYKRHLAAHGMEHSGNAWRHFSSERFNSKFIRPRCC